jgi:septin family protein
VLIEKSEEEEEELEEAAESIPCTPYAILGASQALRFHWRIAG